MTKQGRHAGWTMDQIVTPPAPPLNFNWVGGRDGSGNGDWNTARDWNPAQVPDSSASVTFATGLSGYTVTGDATTSAIVVAGDGVTFDGAIGEAPGGAAFFLTAVNGGQVTIDSNGSVTGQALNFADGTLLDVQGGLIASGGVADVAIVEGLDGQMIVAGTLQLNQLYVQAGGAYTGSVVLNDGGSVTLDTSSSFGGGSLTLLGSGSIYAAAAPQSSGGTLGVGEAIVTGAAGSFLSLGADPGVTLAFGAAISGGANLVIDGGTVELASANSFTGFAEAMSGGTLQIDQPGAIPSNLVFLDNGSFVNLSNLGGTLVVPYQDTVVAGGASDTIDAAGGGLLVFGASAGSLNFVGGTTSSTVIGGSGAMSVTGGLAGDLVFGGTSGHDVFHTGAGNSTLAGGAGAQLFADGAGNSVLVAGGASVTADASQDTGTVTVFGAAGDAISVLGGAGTVYAVVNYSDATIYGGPGTMDVFSSTGSLSLDFVVGFGGGSTNVVGFDASRDVITLVGYAQGSAAQALASETVTGGNTFLELSDATKIALFGVTDLTAANFVSY